MVSDSVLVVALSEYALELPLEVELDVHCNLCGGVVWVVRFGFDFELNLSEMRELKIK